MSTPCYYCEYPRTLCKYCLHGELDADDVKTLEQQRDELLAALENAEEYLREYADAPILAVGLRSLISKVKK